MGTRSPSPIATQPPIFGHVYCGQTAAWIKMRLGMEVGLGPGHAVLDADPAPPSAEKGVQYLKIFGPVYSSQTAAWINMPLGMEVTRPKRQCVRWGPSSPPQNAPNFRSVLMWPNGCVDQDATWYDDRPRPGQHCVRCGPRFTPPPPPPRGTPPTTNRPMSVVAKRLDESRCHLVRK